MFRNGPTNVFGLEKLGLDKLQEHPSGKILTQLLFIIAFTAAAHGLVRLVRYVSEWLVRKSAAQKSPVGFVTHQPKFITLTRLVASGLTFVIYSVALGFILAAFGLNPKQFLTTYLATASVVALAVGFGSQGLVQDVVTGLTLIFSDTLDVGDLIEVSGAIGRVERVGLRFTELTNFFNQQVFVPNRTIANIARFPRGGVNAYADVQIPAHADWKVVIETVSRIARGTWLEFSAVILSEPELAEPQTVEAGGWSYLRVQFHIWPGQGALIETTFRQRIVTTFKAMDASYTDWMVAVTYRAAPVSPVRGEAAI